MVDIKEYFKIDEYIIKNGLINTDDNVALIKIVKKLPVQFDHVDGNFDCYDNKLTSLEGSPKSVGGYFRCNNNQLISLDGAPQSVGGYFYCDWSENLPLLRLVRYQNVQTYNDQVNKIINKYSNHNPLKEAILLCQKELIDNGFIGNASW